MTMASTNMTKKTKEAMRVWGSVGGGRYDGVQIAKVSFSCVDGDDASACLTIHVVHSDLYLF